MKYIIFAVFLLDVFLPSSSSHRVPFYRTDYTYVEELDAFYKVHDHIVEDATGSAWSAALITCADEGATLFYPKAQGEWALVKNLTNKNSNMTDILVGFHNEYKLGEFITADGQSMPDPVASDSSLVPDLQLDPLDADSSRLLDPQADQNSPHHDNCITMNIDSGLFKMDNCSRTPGMLLPFLCKKVEGKSCPTVDRGYKYMKASRKCYKVNKKLRLWQEAMKTCFVEGGILAVIENMAQAEEVKAMLEPGVSYFVGVRKLISYNGGYKTIYYTVKGKKFSDMYQWENEPSSSRDYGTVSNNQGPFLSTGTARGVDRLPFICEMDVAV